MIPSRSVLSHLRVIVVRRSLVGSRPPGQLRPEIILQVILYLYSVYICQNCLAALSQRTGGTVCLLGLPGGVSLLFINRIQHLFLCKLLLTVYCLKGTYLVLCISIQLAIQPCVHCFSFFVSSVFGVQPTLDRRYLGKYFQKLPESTT